MRDLPGSHACRMRLSVQLAASDEREGGEAVSQVLNENALLTG
ncbi:hypothetical protein [Trinickia soli]|nr:hypothetical protein [Trinickia soli]